MKGLRGSEMEQGTQDTHAWRVFVRVRQALRNFGARSLLLTGFRASSGYPNSPERENAV